MPTFRFSASIEAGQTQVWSVGGSGWFTDDHFPQLDVRPVAVPGEFPPSGDSPELIYKDFSCSMKAVSPYLAEYHVTVVNNSDRTLTYNMRVWVP